MKVKKITLHILAFLFLSSCIIRIDAPSLKSGYLKLSKATQDSIIFTAPIFNIVEKKNDGLIYAITGQQLAKALTNQDTAIVYLWNPNCHAEACVLLNSAQNRCTEKGYNLFVVAEKYGSFKEIRAQSPSLDNPLFSINEFHYNTKYYKTYTKLFIKDLTKNKKPLTKRFFMFVKGKLITTSSNLFSL